MRRGALGGREQLLAGAFGHHDYGVATTGEPLGEHIENPAFALQRERHLGNEAQVHVRSGQRGIRGDEAGVTTHQLDQTDAVQRAARFGVRRADGPRRRLDGGGETEAAFDPVQVVVDRLGDADHGER